MSNYSTVETDKAVIRVHLTDGTMKSFLVTQSQTPNAVKFLVCKKLGLDVKEFNMFGLYVVENDSTLSSVTENPFALHVKWGPKVNGKYKFLFKRLDEQWPPSLDKSSKEASQTSLPTSENEQTMPNESDVQETANDQQVDEGSSSGAIRGFGYNVSSGDLDRASIRKTNPPSRANQNKAALLAWVNSCVASYGLSINNLSTDMSDGVVLFRLLEVVTHKTLKGWHTSPANMMLKLDNLTMYLRILEYFGIKISGVSPEDIYSGNENIITALLLLLIKKYSIPIETTEEYLDQIDDGNQDAYQEQQQADESTMVEDSCGPPPDESAPEPPPEAVAQRMSAKMTGSTGTEPPPASGPLYRTSRARSKMVAPQESYQTPSTIPALASKPQVPPTLGQAALETPSTAAPSLLLGGPIDMPFNSILGAPSAVNPILMPISVPQVPSASQPILAQPHSLMQAGLAQSNSPLVSPSSSQQAPLPATTKVPLVAPLAKPPPPLTQTIPSMQNPSNPAPLNQAGPPQAKQPLVGRPGLGPKVGTGMPPKFAGNPPKNNTLPPKVGLGPKVANGMPPKFAGNPKMVGVPPKMAPKQGPPKMGQAPPKMPSGPRPVSRPLPQPILSSPPEEMDINIVPQGAVQDNTPALEMDFSVPVPGSETAQRQRTRASTISNINTNVFDLDAFSDMEDLLLGLADGFNAQ